MPTLDWEISEAPVFDHEGRAITGYKRLTHGTTGQTFAVVSQAYHPVRNEQLLEHVQAIVERTPLAVHGFAVFREGRRVMAFLEDGSESRKVGRWPARDYMIIGNSHDKSTAFFTGYTSHIVRCENQFTVGNQQVRVHHTRGAEQRLADLIHCTELYYNTRTGMYESMEQMEQTPLLAGEVRELTERLLDIHPNIEPSAVKKNSRANLERCMSVEIEAFGPNLLGAFNGVTRYTSREMRQRHPVFGNPFGRAAELNERALLMIQQRAAARRPMSYAVAPMIEQPRPRVLSDW